MKTMLLIGTGLTLLIAASRCISQPLTSPGQVGPSGSGSQPLAKRFVSSTECQSAGINNGMQYLNSPTHYVRILNGNYHIGHDYGNHPSPGDFSPLAPNDPAAPWLIAAFDLAPASLRNLLCEKLPNGLPRTMVVVDDNNAGGPQEGAWSQWKPRHPGDQTEQRYIGLNRQFLTLPLPLQLSDYETFQLYYLLHLPQGHGDDNGNLIHTSVSISPSDTPQMTVLSAVAHEMGHLLYFDTAAAASPPEPVWGADFCGSGQYFHKVLWQNPDQGFGEGKFHGFGAKDPNNGVANGVFAIWDVRDDLARYKPSQPSTKPYLDKAANDMLTIYQGSGSRPSWADLFATVAKDEDFVETYRLMVLMRAQNGSALKSLSLRIGASTTTPVDVVANINSGTGLLADKVKCITNSVLPDPIP